jgi:hypothetical protein
MSGVTRLTGTPSSYQLADELQSVTVRRQPHV